MVVGVDVAPKVQGQLAAPLDAAQTAQWVVTAAARSKFSGRGQCAESASPALHAHVCQFSRLSSSIIQYPALSEAE